MRVTAIYLFLTALIFLSASCSGEKAAVEAQTAAFLRTYRALNFSGLPNPGQLKAIENYITPRLRGLFQEARKVQLEFIRKYPDDKPPLCEGDMFSSLFEGFTSFSIGKVKITGPRAEVMVHFMFENPDERPERASFSWSDLYVLVKDPVSLTWRIDDVNHLGKWDFASKGSLVDALTGVKEGK